MRYVDTHYWRRGKPELNLGEAFVDPLLNLFDTADRRTAKERTRSNGAVLLTIGSEFNRATIRRLKKRFDRIVVWGYGYSHGEIPAVNDLDVRAVRGRHTLDALDLPRDTPVGDPGLLISRAIAIHRENLSISKASYVPHWHSRHMYSGAVIDVATRPGLLAGKLRQLVGSEFIYTSSLHTAIACIAYGVPFAPFKKADEAINKPLKWKDAFSVFDVAPVWSISEEDARNWYDANTSKLLPGKQLDALQNSIADAFPMDIFQPAT